MTMRDGLPRLCLAVCAMLIFRAMHLGPRRLTSILSVLSCIDLQTRQSRLTALRST